MIDKATDQDAGLAQKIPQTRAETHPGWTRTTKIQFLGWILFIISAIGFIIASIGSFWAMFGSLFFLLACLVFMIPFFRKD